MNLESQYRQILPTKFNIIAILILLPLELNSQILSSLSTVIVDSIQTVIDLSESLPFPIGITALVQSSSITISLIVSLVATGKISLKKSFHFIMRANIGTALTALIAPLFSSEAALYLAITYLTFNFIGVLILFFFPAISNIPISLAKQLGIIMLKNGGIGFLYILIVFFLIPFLLIYVSSMS